MIKQSYSNSQISQKSRWDVLARSEFRQSFTADWWITPINKRNAFFGQAFLRGSFVFRSPFKYFFIFKINKTSNLVARFLYGWFRINWDINHGIDLLIAWNGGKHSSRVNHNKDCHLCDNSTTHAIYITQLDGEKWNEGMQPWPVSSNTNNK